MRSASALLAALSLVVTPPPASACPNCVAGRTARAEVFGQDFGRNLSVALAPFLVISLVAAAAHRSGRRARLDADTTLAPFPPKGTPS